MISAYKASLLFAYTMEDTNDNNTGAAAPRDDGVNMDIDENLGGNLGLANEAEDGDDESFNVMEDIRTDDISSLKAAVFVLRLKIRECSTVK